MLPWLGSNTHCAGLIVAEAAAQARSRSGWLQDGRASRPTSSAAHLAAPEEHSAA